MAPSDILPLDYLCLSKGNFEIFLRELLLVKNYRVEVFVNKSRANEWAVELRGSPGNLIQFENLLFNNNEMELGTAIIALNIKAEGQQKVIIPKKEKIYIILHSLCILAYWCGMY